MLAIFLFLFFGFPAAIGGEPDYLCMFWNVENLFEDRPHFRDKCNGIAKTICLAGDEFGRMPDIIGLAEVENEAVVRKLVSGTVLRGLDYGIVHYDSPDRRGIDCALLYRRSKFRILHSKPCHLADSSRRLLPTRDILLAVLEPVALSDGLPPEGRATRGTEAGAAMGLACEKAMQVPGSPCGTRTCPLLFADGPSGPIAVLVNHHPSKVGKGSEERRKIAMDRLMFLRDSLLAEGISRIVAVGDFNDEVIPAEGVEAAYPKGAGTIKFHGKWEKIDGCPVLEGLEAREHIFAPPHLSTPDTRHSGLKPLRTFSGPRYLGGLSDHYPILLELVTRYSRGCHP
ncbi:MAG: hypothetical protein IKZ60_06260 [Bacteroidales bacterium]|nr:hypothetical protein [Bacteroidales bacterium]